ncbi:MAG TPA: GNAT family N-acetyltransferase [Actinomycetota bacterium]|nr:GNAT family N-acetyltransferase [Actinomycetota bacterium]
MAAPRDLPDGLTARSLTPDDVDAVVAMINACEIADTGEVMWDRADLLADSSTDGFDRERDWIGVLDDEAFVAWGLIVHRRSAWIDVHPVVRGRGVGTALRLWSIDRAREKGSDRIGQTIDDRRTDVAAMFRAAGYTPRHTSWILRIDHAGTLQEPNPPDGVELRAIRPDDEAATFAMFEEAFTEFTDRLPSSAETWRAMTVGREGFRPDDLVVAVEDGRVIGGALLLNTDDEIWVDKIAVARDRRHRGVARALLETAFRRSADLGHDHTSLSTDSRTGALTLYERLGMRVEASFTNYGIDL